MKVTGIVHQIMQNHFKNAKFLATQHTDIACSIVTVVLLVHYRTV